MQFLLQNLSIMCFCKVFCSPGVLSKVHEEQSWKIKNNAYLSNIESFPRTMELYSRKCANETRKCFLLLEKEQRDIKFYATYEFSSYYDTKNWVF